MATFSVVHFFGDNSVAAVPRFWYSDKNGTCAWPKKPHNTKRLIEQCSIPNKIEYEYLEARVMSSGIGNNCVITNIMYISYNILCVNV